MAYNESNISVSLNAAADLTAAQYKFVSIDSNGAIALTGDGEHADGVLMSAPNTGEAGTVTISGIAKVECGGEVTAGGDVASDANGAAGNAGSGDAVLGTALETGASGRVISILFHPRG